MQGEWIFMRSAEKTLKGKGFIKQEIEKRLSPADAKRVWDLAHGTRMSGT